MWTRSKLIGVGLAIVLVLIIILQNTARVETHLLFATVTMPRAVLLLFTFGLGVVAGLLFAFSLHRRHRK